MMAKLTIAVTAHRHHIWPGAQCLSDSCKWLRYMIIKQLDSADTWPQGICPCTEITKYLIVDNI